MHKLTPHISLLYTHTHTHTLSLSLLQVSISDFLTLFSARTHNGFFWSSRPAPILLYAAGFSLALSTLLACFWPKGRPIKPTFSI
jgi:hypothetical protein